MALDGLLIARAQFAFTIGYHILWPAYSIGISGFIVILGILWLRTGRPVYRALMRFWIHLFALGFAMGVVTGIVLSYEIGTNWSVFAERTSNVIGPFFAYEVLMAFFLEAGFIGIMLFGAGRVSARLHVLSCFVVAAGAVISAFWILAANSWMQTPAGFTLADGKFELASWSAAIFNPSFPYRFAHMVIAAYITGAFLVIGVSGLHVWRRQHLESARTGLSIGLWMALVLVPLQLVLGDLHGLNTLDHQPIKVAAMEGDWETRRAQPLVLFAWPDEEAEANRYALEIPSLGSLILTHDWNGEVEGLKAVPPAERPPVAIVFFAFRLMIGIWIVLLAITVWGAMLRWRGRLVNASRFGLACALTSPLPFVAILSGWTVTEVGRQPFVVYGQLKTADAISPVAAPAVAGSLALFVIVYSVLLLAFLFYAGRMILRGPQPHEPEQEALTVRPGIASALAAARK